MLIFLSDKGISTAELVLAADEALTVMGKLPVGELVKTQSGAPKSMNYRVSVTHTGDLSLLAVASEAVGIDIEKNDRKVPESMKDVRNWTAYEAKRKMTGEGIKLSEVKAGGDYTKGVTFHMFLDGYTVATVGGDETLFVICV